MRLCDDERGRVPFALVGIVLLLASTTLAVTVQPDRPATDPPVDVVMDRTTAATVTELRAAVSDASANAAGSPVLHASNTTAGRVLNESAPFREMLRLRIYLRARDRLADQRIEQQGVTATASLPPTPNASALRAAKRRVAIDTVDGNETKIRVTVENVTVTARRGNRTVGRKSVSPTVTVRTPVLALHEQVGEFETRLDRGLDEPGLSQRVTGQLYPLTWARGYAQYGSGGQAITNVLANRHVELLTNGALLDEQRAMFDRSDAAGRKALGQAVAGVALTDLVAETPGETGWLRTLFRGGPPGSNVPGRVTRLTRNANGPGPSEQMRVEINGTADRAFATAATSENITRVLQSVYSADVKLASRVTGQKRLVAPCLGNRPGVGWILDRNETSVEKKATVIGDSNQYDTPSPGPEWHKIQSTTRIVRLNVTRTCHWDGLNESTKTTVWERNQLTVRLTLAGRHAHSRHAPDEPMHSLEGTGRFDGLNVTKIHDEAVSQRIDESGGWDGLAKRAARGGLDTSPTVINGTVPEGLHQRALADLVRLTDRVRNVSTTIRRGRAATYHVNPAGRLRQRLASQRRSLLRTPVTYQSPAHKARVAVRGAYLDRARELLWNRRNDRLDRRGRLDRLLGDVSGSIDLLKRAFRNRGGTGGRSDTAIDGVRVTAVDGAPPYLTTTAVGQQFVDSLEGGETITPLATKNVNLFTLPSGDAADAVLEFVGLGKKVSFRTAARTLDGLDSAESLAPNQTVATNVSNQRARLGTAVENKLNVTKRRYLRQALSDTGVGTSRSERLDLVEEGLGKWDTTADRALAVTNGSAVGSITETAVDGNETRRALLRANLRLQSFEAANAKDTRIPLSKVEKGAALMRDELATSLNDRVRNATETAGETVADRVEARLGRSVNSVPAGMPLVPIGTPWFATTNVWYVEVKGGYDRFAVRAETGSAGDPGSSVTYVRDGSAVGLDFDDDGQTERFGRSERVSFSFRTAVSILVPPGAQGVGDKDGNMDERSGGWSSWASVDTDRPVCQRGQSTQRTLPVQTTVPTNMRQCRTSRPVPAGWPARGTE